MNENEIKQVASSLITSRLSPLAKPFTLNRSSYSLSPQPSLNSDHNHNDPFSSLLDSFRKTNLTSKAHSVSLNDTVKITTLPLEAASLTHETSLVQDNPFLELAKNRHFHDGLNGSHFDFANSVGDVSMLRKGCFFVACLIFFFFQ